MIIIHGSAEVMPENFDQALSLSLAHVQRSREEAGCISHHVSQDAENKLCLVFVEEWENMDAVQAHFALPSSQSFVAELSPLLSKKADLRLFNASLLER